MRREPPPNRPTITSSYLDYNGRWIMQAHVPDPCMWSRLTGQAATVPRDFPWWALWRWPGLWLLRRRCRLAARYGPCTGLSVGFEVLREGSASRYDVVREPGDG